MLYLQCAIETTQEGRERMSMVKRVYVHAPQTVDGKRTQEIDIVYDLVGILPQSLFKHEETA